jgi:putative ATP-dependent endonuclease of OLD family
LLDFLKEQAAASGRDASLAAAGKVQVVVTTHSPTLASTVSINNVVVVARDDNTSQWRTGTTALWTLGLDAAQTRKIDRYLTVTRASLLFAREVILVEGIAEMLVLPALARYHLTTAPDGRLSGSAADADSSTADADQPTEVDGSPGVNTAEQSQSAGTQPKGADAQPEGVSAYTYAGAAAHGRRRLRQFRSATIVSVEGVDFEPYLQLLLAGDYHRVDRVVVVTDRDHTDAGQHRKDRYLASFAGAAQGGRLSVEVGGTTLEAELFGIPANEELLRTAFERLHPGSKHHWETVVNAVQGKDDDVRAETFAQAIRAKSPQEQFYLDISKGEFAHLVAEAIHEAGDASPFVVPEYLRNAIDAVTDLGEGS